MFLIFECELSANMEAAGRNTRECSVQLWKCDLDNRSADAVRAEPGVLAEHQGRVTLRAPAADMVYVEDGNEMPVIVKTEHDSEDAVSTAKSGASHKQVRKHSVTDVALHIEQEVNFVIKKENEMDVTVKQELDVGPTVLQLQTVARFPPPAQAGMLNLWPGISAVDDDAAAAPLNTKMEHDDCKDYSEVASDTSLVHSCDRSDGEGTSTSTPENDQCKYCIRSRTECVCRTADVSRAEVDTPPGGKPRESDYCKNGTTIKSDLINQACTYMWEKPCKYEKHECGDSQLGHLEKRMRTHSNEKSHKCDRCEYSASQLGHLKKHMRIHTGEKPYKCEWCEYSASRIEHLRRHVHSHMGKKPYKCEQCEYSTARLDSLKRHTRTHSGENLYKCEWCEYSAYRIEYLERHMYSHMGKKPYKCEQCEYSTSRLGNLRRHTHTHTAQKLYKCDQCKYSTPRLGNLKRHTQTHRDEQIYKCDHCKYYAWQPGILKRHMRSHAGEKS